MSKTKQSREILVDVTHTHVSTWLLDSVQNNEDISRRLKFIFAPKVEQWVQIENDKMN